MLYIRCIGLLLVFLLPASCGRHALRQHLAASPVPSQKGDFSSQLHLAEDSFALDGAIPLDWVLEGQSRHAQFEQLFQSLQKTHEFSGTVLIAERGEIVHTGAYGYANLRQKEKINLHTSFQLASVSKTITAVAALQLYESGLIALDEPVQSYLEEFPYKRITVKHLLAHRSGLCRYMGLAHEHWNRRYYLSTQQVVELFAEHGPRLRFRPGSRFQYNNTNYVLLAAMIERVSGLAFEEYLEKKIFQPLGMNHSEAYNILERRNEPGQALGYIKKHHRYVVAEGDYLDAAMGDKGIYSTVEDLFAFDQALYEGKLLNPATTEMALRAVGNDYRGRNYSLGWRLKRWLPHVVYHFGWWRGFRTCFIRDLEHKRTIIILSNRVNPYKQLNYWRIYQAAHKIAEATLPISESLHKRDSLM